MVYTNPCANCGYWWQEEWEDYPSCHYEGPTEWAPCEQDDFQDTEEYDPDLYYGFWEDEMADEWDPDCDLGPSDDESC